MRKIGYTVKTGSAEESRYLYLVEECQAVIELEDTQDNGENFRNFLLDYQNDELVVVSFESIGLQLSQLAPFFELIKVEKIKLHFVEKPVETDEMYLEILEKLALSEKEIVSRRTLKGLRLAHAKGIVSGRPTIDDLTIARINYLHTAKKKNIRQIAMECGVSLGTVHKYINLND